MRPLLPVTSSSATAQAVRFLVVGGVATAVDVGLFNVLHLGLKVDPVGAKSLSTVVAAVVAFVGNRQWSFATSASPITDTSGRQVGRYVLVTAASLLVALVPIWVCRDGLGMRGPIAMNVSANVVGLALATGFRFYAYRRWVFDGRAPLPGARSGAVLSPAQATT